MEDKFTSLPDMLLRRCHERGTSVAHYFKEDGEYKPVTWAAFGSIVREVAAGLMESGVEGGQSVALLSASRAEWVYCDFGIMMTGAKTIPIYPSTTSEGCAYIINDADVSIVIVENHDQMDKILEAADDIDGVEEIILIDGDPLPDTPIPVRTLQDLRNSGQSTSESAIRERVRKIDRDDLATIVYTSGTTGPPKGVMQTHGNHLSMVENLSQDVEIREDDVDLLFLPLAHSFARCEEFAGVYLGLTTYFAESIQDVPQNMQEAQPTLLFSVPRIYEKAYAKIQDKLKHAPDLERIPAEWALKVGKEQSRLIQEKEPIPFGQKVKYALASRILNKLKSKVFGPRLRMCISGGAPLSPQIAEFFHSMGVLILEGYGLTETCPCLTVNREDDFKFGTVGQAINEVELKIADDGEILARGPNVVSGYYGLEEATKRAFEEDGWFHTGDIGEIDENGFLRITDRKKDLIVTAGGKNIAPQNIENLLKNDPYISQAMVHGDKRKFLSAVVCADPEAVEKWARKEGIDGADDYGELVAKPEVQEFLWQRVEKVNETLPRYETIKKIVVADRDFSVDGGELTPTLKVKRRVVTKRYDEALDALYEEPRETTATGANPGTKDPQKKDEEQQEGTEEMANVATAEAHGEVEPTGMKVANGKLAMWLFLGSDAMGFTGLLAAYAALRAGSRVWPGGPGEDGVWGAVQGYNVQDFLSIELTAFATFVLICSSVTMVKALEGATEGDQGKLKKYLGLTIFGGLFFLGFQYFEWTHFMHQGFYPSTANFWATFYAVTGFHGMHVAGGVVLLTCIFVQALRGVYDENNFLSVEVVGLYWHFVDLVWILVFTFIYLI